MNQVEERQDAGDPPTPVEVITRQQQMRNASKKCYNKKVKEDPEFYSAEKQRIKEYKKNRYAYDPVYREKEKARMSEAYRLKKIKSSIVIN